MNAPGGRRLGGVWLALLIGSGTGALLLMFLVAVVLIGLGLMSGGPGASSLPDPVDFARLGADGPGDDFAAPPASRRIELADGTRIDESQVAYALRREGNAESWATYNWLYGGAAVTTVAPGLDRRHHFANAYLVGYVPFPDVAPWVPLYALSQRKHYRFDHEQYPGMPEIWQTSREAFHYRDGDCEDHAIALADWMIGLGMDARVVLGQVDEGGHAWVVLFDEGRTYLLEATDKHRRQGQALPLAETLPEYRPEAMFDRERYWVNTGNPRTTDYGGAQWQLVSTFRREAPGAEPGRRPPPREPEGRPREKQIRR